MASSRACLVAQVLQKFLVSVGYEPRSYWSDVAEAIHRRGSDSDVAGDATPFLRHQRRLFLQRFLEPLEISDKRVLEVGCGPGGNLAELRRRGQARELVGADISPAMLELARARVPDVELVETDGTTLPFPDERFDLVFTVTVLQHNRDETCRPLLAEICRVAGDRLLLIENTGPQRRDDFVSTIRRPVAEYVEVCEPLGFRLLATAFLGVAVSSKMQFVARRFGKPSAVGEPAPRLRQVVESALLPASVLADRVVPQRAGLTMMDFRRRPY
jgi:SAM-dependent methyltransferase